jgi:hypothetical protein
MRFAVEYKSKSGTVGLILFSAKDLNSAQVYAEELIDYYGHDHVFNLNPLVDGTVEELYRLFPAKTHRIDEPKID